MSAVEEKLEAIAGFEYRQYLDGKKLYAWLERANPEGMTHQEATYGEAVARRLYDWKATEYPVSYDSADRILVKMGLHIDVDVPAECWLPLVQYYNKGPHAHNRERAEELLDEGRSCSEVAKRLGVNKGVVRRWELDREIRERADENWKKAGLERAGLEPDPERPGRVIA